MGEALLLEDLLPSRDAGPEAAYARSVLLDELDLALEELPEEQRAVFVGHEIDGYSLSRPRSFEVSLGRLTFKSHYVTDSVDRFRFTALAASGKCVRHVDLSALDFFSQAHHSCRNGNRFTAPKTRHSTVAL